MKELSRAVVWRDQERFAQQLRFLDAENSKSWRIERGDEVVVITSLMLRMPRIISLSVKSEFNVPPHPSNQTSVVKLFFQRQQEQHQWFSHIFNTLLSPPCLTLMTFIPMMVDQCILTPTIVQVAIMDIPMRSSMDREVIWVEKCRSSKGETGMKGLLPLELVGK